MLTQLFRAGLRPVALFAGFLLFTALAFGQAPTITTQPAVVTATSGTTATFTVVASGAGPLTYQWRRLGANIGGATANTLTLSNVTMTDAGFYDVVVTAGSFSTTSQAGRLIVAPASYSDTLRLDTSFAPALGIYGGSVEAVATLPDGRYFVCGYFSSIAGVGRSNIVRFFADGSIDPAFSAAIMDGAVFSIALQSDGKVVIGGYFTAVGGVSRNRIARLNGDGSLDTAFNPGGGFSSSVLSLAVQADGKIVAGGYFTSFNETARNYIARLNSDGSLDTAFVPGSGFDGWVDSLAV